MPDASWVGHVTAPAGPFQVGRETVRGFATSIGDEGPLSHDVEYARAAGFPDVVAPPTFSTVFTMPVIETFLRDPALDWDYTRMVHGDQSIVFHRPIHAGDELSTVVHVDDLRTRAGSHMLTLRCEVSDEQGTAVVTTRSMLVTTAEDGS